MNISNKIRFRDDQTNEVVFYTPLIEKVNDFLKVTGVFNLLEGHFYDLSISNNFDIWNENLDFWQLSPDNWDDRKPV